MHFNFGDVVEFVHPSGKVGRGTIRGYNLLDHTYVVEWVHEGELEHDTFTEAQITLW